MYGHTWVNYDEFCSDRQIPTLYNRRIELSKYFVTQSVLDKNTCLRYLLSPLRTGFVDKLRSRTQYIPQTAKTSRNSFTVYALNIYQSQFTHDSY